MSQFGDRPITRGLEAGLRIAAENGRSRLLELQADSLEQELVYAQANQITKREQAELDAELTRQNIAAMGPFIRQRQSDALRSELEVKRSTVGLGDDEKKAEANRLTYIQQALQFVESGGGINPETLAGLSPEAQEYLADFLEPVTKRALNEYNRPVSYEDIAAVAKDEAPSESAAAALTTALWGGIEKRKRDTRDRLLGTAGKLIETYGAERGASIGNVLDPQMSGLINQAGGPETFVSRQAEREGFADRAAQVGTSMAYLQQLPPDVAKKVLGTFGASDTEIQAIDDLTPVAPDLRELSPESRMLATQAMTTYGQIAQQYYSIPGADSMLSDLMSRKEAGDRLSDEEETMLGTLQGLRAGMDAQLLSLNALRERQFPSTSKPAPTTKAPVTPKKVDSSAPPVDKVEIPQELKGYIFQGASDESLGKYRKRLADAGVPMSMETLKNERDFQTLKVDLDNTYKQQRQKVINDSSLSQKQINSKLSMLDYSYRSVFQYLDKGRNGLRKSFDIAKKHLKNFKE